MAGRLKVMVNQAMKADSAITCHDTLDGDHAVCRRFYDRYKTEPLKRAREWQMIEEVRP